MIIIIDMFGDEEDNKEPEIIKDEVKYIQWDVEPQLQEVDFNRL
jgi:hypothetical protein